jgi:hypothetical protein
MSLAPSERLGKPIAALTQAADLHALKSGESRGSIAALSTEDPGAAGREQAVVNLAPHLVVLMKKWLKVMMLTIPCSTI